MQNWQWSFRDNQQLVIELDRNIFQHLRFKRSLLRDRLPETVSFSMDDASQFQRFSDYLDTYSAFSASEQFELALHACALVRFGKLMLPQSWYFKFGDFDDLHPWPTTHLFCALDSGLEQADFLIIEQDDRCSLCMLVDEQFSLDGIRTLQRFDVVRVLNDRLQVSLRHPLPVAYDSTQQRA